MAWNLVDRESSDFLRARRVLAERGIPLDPNESTVQELKEELLRRGWNWRLAGDEAEAEKRYTPTGTVSYTTGARGTDQLVTMATVLANAIRFDEERGLSPADPFQADLVVRDPHGHAVALIEVKNRQGLTRGIAMQLRRNLIHYGSAHRIRFFLLASQDSGYLWANANSSTPADPPTTEFSMSPVVARYLSWLGSGERLGGDQLELVVAQWLDDLATGVGIGEGEPETTLAKVGFLQALKGARIIPANDR